MIDPITLEVIRHGLISAVRGDGAQPLPHVVQHGRLRDPRLRHRAARRQRRHRRRRPRHRRVHPRQRLRHQALDRVHRRRRDEAGRRVLQQLPVLVVGAHARPAGVRADPRRRRADRVLLVPRARPRPDGQGHGLRPRLDRHVPGGHLLPGGAPVPRGRDQRRHLQHHPLQQPPAEPHDRRHPGRGVGGGDRRAPGPGAGVQVRRRHAAGGDGGDQRPRRAARPGRAAADAERHVERRRLRRPRRRRSRPAGEDRRHGDGDRRRDDRRLDRQRHRREGSDQPAAGHDRGVQLPRLQGAHHAGVAGDGRQLPAAADHHRRGLGDARRAADADLHAVDRAARRRGDAEGAGRGDARPRAGVLGRRRLLDDGVRRSTRAPAGRGSRRRTRRSGSAPTPAATARTGSCTSPSRAAATTRSRCSR